MLMFVSLLTQQVSAGVMSVSMLNTMSGNMSSSASSEQSSGEMMGTSHQHHQMDSEMSVDDTMEMQDKDCCQGDCVNCFACYHYVISAISLKFLSMDTKQSFQLHPYEPLVHSPDSLFRPPISA